VGRKKRKKKKYSGRNYHHIVPKSRILPCKRTRAKLQELLLMKIDRHDYWHRIFGDMTLDEVVELLTRLQRSKGKK